MTAQQYGKMTSAVRSVCLRCPGGENILRLPTYLCAAVYLASLGWLALRGDLRVIRAAAVPAVCFLTVTALRPIIHRQRPYDAFGIPPVGKWEPGKGKSMPSRHAASAAAIAIAVGYLFPNPWVIGAMAALGLLIAALRVLSGQHYVSDVVAAVILSGLISAVGYGIA